MTLSQLLIIDESKISFYFAYQHMDKDYVPSRAAFSTFYQLVGKETYQTQTSTFFFFFYGVSNINRVLQPSMRSNLVMLLILKSEMSQIYLENLLARTRVLVVTCKQMDASIAEVSSEHVFNKRRVTNGTNSIGKICFCLVPTLLWQELILFNFYVLGY